MSGITNGTCSISKVAFYTLGYPIESIGTEFVAAIILKFFRRSQQSQIALLYQIQEGGSLITIATGNGVNQAQIVHDQEVASLDIALYLCREGFDRGGRSVCYVSVFTRPMMFPGFESGGYLTHLLIAILVHHHFGHADHQTGG